MKSDKLEFQELRALLRRRADDPAVVDVVEQSPTQIERYAYQGFMDFQSCGVSVIFKKAPWVFPASELTDPESLHVSAFHFHRDTHEGHSGYKGSFPGDVKLNDPRAEITRKLGQPSAVGGGGISTVLKKPIARWLRYVIGDEILQFQLDDNDRVEMVTLYAPVPGVGYESGENHEVQQ